jgi:hypothetical protein
MLLSPPNQSDVMAIRVFNRCLLILLTGIFTISFCYAQDSVKKAPARAAVKRPVTPPAGIYTAKPVAIAPQQGVKPVVTNPAYLPPDTAGLRAKPIVQQYQFVQSKLFHYQQIYVSILYKGFADTLKSTHKQLKDIQLRLTVASKTIDSLKADSERKVQQTAERADAIDILGLSLSKGAYNAIMISLIIVLALTLFIVFATTAKFRRDAKYRTTLYEELDEEYKAYKVKANDKEKKLARELQTARNKLDEIAGR